MAESTPAQFADFKAYMRFALDLDSNSGIFGSDDVNGIELYATNDAGPMPEYPAPCFKSARQDEFDQATKLEADENARKQLLRELQNELATAYARAVVIKWIGQPEARLEYVEIPSRVWRDMDTLSDAELLANGFMEREFPKGFKDGALAMRGKVLFFDLRYRRELAPSNRGSSTQIAPIRATRYDWEAFESEAYRHIFDEGGFQPGFSQAECENKMAIWCESNWEKQPSEASIRTHVKNAEAQFIAEFRG